MDGDAKAAAITISVELEQYDSLRIGGPALGPPDAMSKMVALSMAENERYRSMYERAVKQHGDELLHYAMRLCGRNDGAEDLIQETFYHAWRSIHTLRDESRLRAWLFQILRRRHFHIIQKKRFPRVVPLEYAAEVAAPASKQSSLVERETLQAGLDQLDTRFKQPFLMLYLEGLSCESAATELKIPLGTLLSRVFRAKQLLRAAMEPTQSCSQPETLRKLNQYPNTGGDL